MLRAAIYRSIEEMGPERWDGVDPQGGFYLASPWLQTIAGTIALDGLPDSAFVVAERPGEGPVAGLAAYQVSKDAFFLQNPPQLLLGDEAVGEETPFQSPEERARSARLRAALADLLGQSYPSAVCSVPYVFLAAVKARVASAEVYGQLLDGFEQVADEWQARSKGVLFVPEKGWEPLAECLRERGCVSGLLGAQCVLPIRWDTCDEYLGSLRRNRRRTVERELQAFEQSGLEVEIIEGASLPEVVDDLAYLSAKLMERYGHGFDLERERLSYRRISTYLARFATVLVAREGRRMVAFVILYDLDGTLVGGMSGQDYEHPFVHFQINYYEALRLAISRGANAIDYGFGSYEEKTRRGFELRPVIGFFDLGAGARDEVAELLALHDAAVRRQLDQYHRSPWRS
jgi:uncharacterized protein